MTVKELNHEKINQNTISNENISGKYTIPKNTRRQQSLTEEKVGFIFNLYLRFMAYWKPEKFKNFIYTGKVSIGNALYLTKNGSDSQKTLSQQCIDVFNKKILKNTKGYNKSSLIPHIEKTFKLAKINKKNEKSNLKLKENTTLIADVLGKTQNFKTIKKILGKTRTESLANYAAANKNYKLYFALIRREVTPDNEAAVDLLSRTLRDKNKCKDAKLIKKLANTIKDKGQPIIIKNILDIISSGGKLAGAAQKNLNTVLDEGFTLGNTPRERQATIDYINDYEMPEGKLKEAIDKVKKKFSNQNWQKKSVEPRYASQQHPRVKKSLFSSASV